MLTTPVKYGIIMKYFAHILSRLSRRVGLGGSVACASNWWSGGRGFDPRRVRQYSFMELDHETFSVENDYEKFSTAILSLPLIPEGQFMTKECAQILVICLEEWKCSWVNIKKMGKHNGFDQGELLVWHASNGLTLP